MIKRWYIFFVVTTMLLVKANAQFVDMESWGLVEMIEYGSDIFQFKHRDSAVKKITLHGTHLSSRMIWKYKDGILFSYSQKGKSLEDYKVKIFQNSGRIDSLIKIIGKYDDVELIYYLYDSSNVLNKIEFKSIGYKEYKKGCYSTSDI